MQGYLARGRRANVVCGCLVLTFIFELRLLVHRLLQSQRRENMPPVFWAGKLTKSMRLLVNLSNAMAWINGNVRDTGAMKERVKLGYDGVFSNHVEKYDKLGLEFQLRAARMQLDGIEFRGKEVLDVGCGTGVLSFIALEQGASRVVCGDISQYMLDKAQEKATLAGYGENQIVFRQLDAESLPF